MYEDANGENRDDSINAFFRGFSVTNISQLFNVKKVFRGIVILLPGP